jgi:hypothetical protein
MTMNSNDRRALEDAQEAAALRDAIEKRNDREVSRMLSIGVDPNLSVDGCSMLQLALSHSLMDIARLLLEAGADADVPVAKGEGMTLLMVVAASGMLEAARMLIEFSPNPNCTSCRVGAPPHRLQSGPRRAGRRREHGPPHCCVPRPRGSSQRAPQRRS